MVIQIDYTNTHCEGETLYKTVSMTCQKQSVMVLLVSGEFNYISVIVQNASHRAWRGLGKRFDDIATAIANYKTPAIKAMISKAAELCSE